MLTKIKEFEASRSEGYIGSFFGGKSDEEKAKDRREIQEYKARLNREFEKKYNELENKMNERMENLVIEGDLGLI